VGSSVTFAVQNQIPMLITTNVAEIIACQNVLAAAKQKRNVHAKKKLMYAWFVYLFFSVTNTNN